MTHVYKLKNCKEDVDITIGYFTSRNKAFLRAEDIIKRSGQRVLFKRKRPEMTDLVGNEGSYFVIEKIWVE